MSKEYEKLKRKWSEYESALEAVERLLSEVLDFEFSIAYIPGDGFMLLDVLTDKMSPVKIALKYLKDDRIYTRDIHEQHNF